VIYLPSQFINKSDRVKFHDRTIQQFFWQRTAGRSHFAICIFSFTIRMVGNCGPNQSICCLWPGIYHIMKILLPLTAACGFPYYCGFKKHSKTRISIIRLRRTKQPKTSEEGSTWTQQRIYRSVNTAAHRCK